jgi:hypothetical protein
MTVIPLPYLPKLDLKSIGTYELKAVSELRMRGIAHSVPILRTEEGKYIALDDLAGSPSEVSEAKLSEILSDKQRWQVAYYEPIPKVIADDP